MTEPITTTTAPDETGGSPWASGLSMFAAILMILSGAFQAFAGLVGLLENEFYVSTPKYLLQFDATSWGWIHLLLGLLVVGAGFAVISGKTWGRVVGIILVVISALANFAFIPYYPVWSLLIITLDIFVIWALATYRRGVA